MRKSGTAKIATDSEGGQQLVFTNFKTDPGPDLDVYLSTQNRPQDHIDLGELKGTEGQFFYDLPDGVDFTTHNHVIIWCKRFSVAFGYAKLDSN